LRAVFLVFWGRTREVVMAQEQIHGKREDKEEVPAAPQESVKDEELADETDDLLDEIDAVLEENAEEFVAAYIQKGGQ
jgi:ubiquitin-like protein Pup